MKQIVMLLPLLISCAALAGVPQKDVQLISRYTGGTYNTSLYSFVYGSRNDVKNDNYGEIQFEARDDFNDYFNTVTVTDQVGAIVDLGELSCKTLKNQYEASGNGYPTKGDRDKNPMLWMEYSDAWSQLQNSTVSSKADVHVGHCYLVHRVDSQHRVVAVFHVKSAVKSKTVDLDELEVFDISNLSHSGRAPGSASSIPVRKISELRHRSK